VAYIASRSLLNNLVYVSLGLLFGSALLSLDWSRRITRPIMRLYDATKEVEKGKFDIQVTPTSRDEIGDLAFSFNQMAAGLTSREEALQQAQAQLIQSEKMAAFGQLGAGIAHEVKNPLAGILGYVQLSLRKVDGASPLHGNLKIIEKETKRCKEIIDNLLKFARQEKVSFEPMDINRVVEETAALMDHQLGIHQIRLEKELAPDLPPVLGNANQIQQVLMNLMINAEQAMEGNPGRIRLSTSRSSSGRIEIRVSDTGPGIPAEIQKKLFEPFFTTKPAGKGTGLGLSVTYGIIKEHKGDIRVESEPGRGAMFIIEFPVPEIAGTTAPQVALT
jgi:signal transduction histidine kinase